MQAEYLSDHKEMDERHNLVQKVVSVFLDVGFVAPRPPETFIYYKAARDGIHYNQDHQSTK